MGQIRLALAVVIVVSMALGAGRGASGQTEGDPPVIQLAFYDAYAEPGDPVSFDASLSLDPQGGPLTFEWDFNGDGVVDLVTADPFVIHVYSEPFEGEGMLRVVTADGRSATTTVEVHIAPEVELRAMFEPPGPPRSVEARRSSRYVAVLTWEPPSTGGVVAGYVARIAEDGMPAGVAGPQETRLEIAELPDSEVVLLLEAVNDRNRASEPVEVTVPAAPDRGGWSRWLWLLAAAVIVGVAAAAWLVVRRIRRPT